MSPAASVPPGPVKPAPFTATSVTVVALDPPRIAIWNDSNSSRAAVSDFATGVPTAVNPESVVSPSRIVTLGPKTATAAGVAATEAVGSAATSTATTNTTGAAN